MFKKLFVLLVVSVFIISCGNKTNQTQNQDEPVEIAMLNIADFDKDAADHVGEEVKVEGTVVHVCKHGGKRMFVMDEDPDVRVKVTVNENMPSFDVELEGSDIVVTGVIDELRIDEDYLVEWELELAEQANAEPEEGEGEEVEDEEGEEHEEGEHAEEEHEGQHMGQGEKADQGEHRDAYDMIEEYRTQIAESEKGYIAFYSIVCNDYKEKKSE